MTTLSKVELVQGLSMPFFPMRPRKGQSLSVVDLLTMSQTADDYIWQLKLNGDRVCVALGFSSEPLIQNRHGSWYSYAVDLGDLRDLKGKWVFDGEVCKSKFYPFEALVVDGESLLHEGPEVRIESAEVACKVVSHEWLYGDGQQDVFARAIEFAKTRSKQYEGIVGKKKGSSYIPLANSSKESANWVKRRH